MNLILIRHPESEFNTKQTTDLNSRLTIKGLKQAVLTAEFLEEYLHNDDTNYTIEYSPYDRTTILTEIIQYRLGYCINKNIVLREHLYLSEISQNQLPLKVDGFQFWDESYSSIFYRMYDYYYSKCIDKPKIIVSHGTPIHILRYLCSGGIEYCISLEQFDKNIKNASITHFVDGKFLLDNYVGHLK